MDPVITTGSTGNRSYTANWKENSYVIRFIPYGDGTTGSMQDMQLMYTDKAALSANQFKRTGYTFAGWTKRQERTGYMMIMKLSVDLEQQIMK